MKILKYVLILASVCFVSCVKDVDFDQVDDIEINTIHNVSLIHFDMNSSNFMDDFGNEVLLRSDTTDLPIFRGNYTVNNLNQADFKYRFSNSFNRSISLDLEFLDDYNSSLFKFQNIIIDASVSEFEVTQRLEEFQLQRLPSARSVVVNIFLSPGNPPLDPAQTYLLRSQLAVLLFYKVAPNDE